MERANVNGIELEYEIKGAQAGSLDACRRLRSMV